MRKFLATAGSVAIVLVGVGFVFYFFFPEATVELFVRAKMKHAGLERHTVTVEGRPVAYMSGGQGEPLILLHGFGSNKYNWLEIAPYLTPYYQLIIPDLPGHGDTEKTLSDSYGYDDFVAFVDAFAKQQGLSSFHLAGNSMGGRIAGGYAARYPGKVKTLWLLAPGGVASADRSELDRLKDKGDQPLLIETDEDYQRLLDLALVEKPFLPTPAKKVLAAQAIANRRHLAKLLENLFAHPVPLEEDVKGLDVPTLILWGEQDQLLHVSGARILGEAIPGATVVILPRTGHVAMVERPEESAQAFLEFQASRR